jgi:transcriptional regulator with XRE-family HTH domain
MTSDLGGRIRKARLALNLTQDEFARRIGVSKVAVARYEAGRIPRTRILATIARVTGLNLNNLLEPDVAAHPSARSTRRASSSRTLEKAKALIEPDWRTDPWRQLSEESRTRYVERTKALVRQLSQNLEDYRQVLLNEVGTRKPK